MYILWNELCKKIYNFEDIIYTRLMQKKDKVKNRDFVRRANLILVIDELMYVMENEKLMSFHKALLTRGRNYKISHVGASQRNQNISKIITTQSYHKVIFKIDDYDISALSKRIANIELSTSLPDYSFIIHNQNRRKPKFYKPVELVMYE